MPSYRFIDPQVLLTAVGGDADAFRQLSDVFLSIGPDAFERLRLALQKRDLQAIAQASHALKGSTMLVGATRLTGMLQELERNARSATLQDPEAALPALGEQFDGVMAEVGASRAAPPAVEPQA